MAVVRLLGRQLCRHCKLVAVGGCLLVAFYYYIGGYYLSSVDNGRLYTTRWSIDSLKFSNETCVQPQLELWNDRLRQLFTAPPPLTCSDVQANWVHVDNGTFQISNDAVKGHGSVTCDYIPVLRGKDEFEVLQGTEIKSIRNGSLITSDAFRVECTGSDGKTFSNVYSAISPKKQVLDRSRKLFRLLPDTALKLNIIMFGFDSVSRLTWMRNLPKSYEYLVNKLGAVVMKGYNVVGDGTPQALLPILTGFSEPELPEARRGFAGAKTVDDHPWIWNRLKDVGYVTQWGEESPSIGTFTYRMLGFRDQPVDHYMRTFFLAAEPQYRLHQPYCLGSVPRHAVMMRWARDFLDAYPDRLKFSFVFHSEYTHDANSKLQWADDDLRRFLEYIDEKGHLDNSLLVLMSDHGARFQNVRVTEQGKYEERMPFLALRVPPWFSRRYPQVVRNIRTNADRLTTPFDLHETLVDVVNFTVQEDRRSREQRGISLFGEIPVDRSCAAAGIEPHWCTCLQWQNVSTGSVVVRQAANEVISVINRLTETRSSQCARLSVGDVTAASRYVAGTDLLRFRRSSDVHGRTADLSDNMQPTTEFYQVTFVARPSNALYEATVKRTTTDAEDGHVQYSVNVRDISRINRYGTQPACVATQLPHLRPFCFCIHR